MWRAVAAGVAFGCVVALVPMTLEQRGAALPPTEPTSDPVAFVERVVRLVSANRYREAWQSLNPLHQRAAPLSRYVYCEQLTPIPGSLTSLRILSVARSQVNVTSNIRRDGYAVEVRLVIAGRPVPEGVVITHVFHAVASAGEWTWVLPPARLAAYRHGRCPGVTATA